MKVLVLSYQEGFAALDVLHHANQYLTKQYSDQMKRDEAMAHFEARQLLSRHGLALLDEMKLSYINDQKIM